MRCVLLQNNRYLLYCRYSLLLVLYIGLLWGKSQTEKLTFCLQSCFDTQKKAALYFTEKIKVVGLVKSLNWEENGS